MNTSTTPAMEPAPSSFAGRVALVTGGAGAIGRATARALAARGATVIAADIDGFETSRDASDAFSEVRLDVTSKSDVTAVVARAVAAHGGIDLLVNVAGVISHGTARDLAEAEWDRVLAINLKGTATRGRGSTPASSCAPATSRTACPRPACTR